MAQQPICLDLESVIGFGGKVRDGLVYHPNGKHVLYPLGMTLVVKRLADDKQEFLDGHTNVISSVALSNSGKLAASGQMTHAGFKAEVIIWDLDIAFAGDDDGSDGEVGARAKTQVLRMHRVRVVDLAFSSDDMFLASLGGDEDSNRIIVWEVSCGAPKREQATKGATTIEWLKNEKDKFLSVGKTKDAFVLYDIHGSSDGNMSSVPMALHGLKRKVMSVQIDNQDRFMFCGTTSGDILVIFMKSLMLAHIKTIKQFSGRGVCCLTYCTDVDGAEYLLAGVGSGQCGLLMINPDDGTLSLTRMTQFDGSVTSISNGYDLKNGYDTFVGTNRGNQYIMNSRTLEWELRLTAHYEPVHDICFPPASSAGAAAASALFVTCSDNDIRVWLTAQKQEALRIQVPKLACYCVRIPFGGASIISGWNDGKIRAFKPSTGKLLYTLPDAHMGGVTALACFNNSGEIITGGQDGRVRRWTDGANDFDTTTSIPRMIGNVKEHAKKVTSVKISRDDTEVISASADGSIIIWDIPASNGKLTGNLKRIRSCQNSTLFTDVMYHPDESQFLTCGSDRRLTYWNASDGKQIRVLEGSEQEINAIDIIERADGDLFVSGGNDRLVRTWNYDRGTLLAIGRGHSGNISRLKISPDGTKIISVGREGGIFIWNLGA